MISKVSGVIGINFGDEGKGQTVSNLVHQDMFNVVVRYNGGAQAGHTVEHNGIRHVFSHFGAGTLKGACTWLTSQFIFNPNVFYVEYNELSQHGIEPEIYCDPKTARITTPLDVLWNRCAEEVRGHNKHGSVGLGINATIKRIDDGIGFCLYDVYNSQTVSEYTGFLIKMNKIREYYETHSREPEIAKCFCSKIEEIEQTTSLDVIYKNFHSRIAFMGSKLKHITDLYGKIAKNDTHVIFEGAQGLQLTEKYGTMPYCTPTDCSSNEFNNAIKGLLYARPSIQFEFSSIDVYYVTRPYVTRHGAGPLEHETDFNTLSKYFNVVDNTNLPNQYQGSIRYGWLDADKIKTIVACEGSHLKILNLKLDYEIGFAINKHITLTCQDQIINSDIVPFVSNDVAKSWVDRFNIDFSSPVIMTGTFADLKNKLK